MAMYVYSPAQQHLYRRACVCAIDSLHPACPLTSE